MRYSDNLVNKLNKNLEKRKEVSESRRFRRCRSVNESDYAETEKLIEVINNDSGLYNLAKRIGKTEGSNARTALKLKETITDYVYNSLAKLKNEGGDLIVQEFAKMPLHKVNWFRVADEFYDEE